MSEESGVLVGRRSRAEIEQLVAVYGSSGMGRSEFCRSQGIGLSTLSRHLKKQRNQQSESRSNSFQAARLVPVEVAAPVAPIAAGEVAGSSIALSINHRRVEVGRGFDAETLVQLVTLLEKL